MHARFSFRWLLHLELLIHMHAEDQIFQWTSSRLDTYITWTAYRQGFTFSAIICWYAWVVDCWLAGKAEGTLYEDDGDSFEYKKGQFLLTRYSAALLSSSTGGSSGKKIVIKITQSDGYLSRPKRPLKVRILLANKAEVSYVSLLYLAWDRQSSTNNWRRLWGQL